MAKVNVSTVLNSINDGITKFNGTGILKDNELIFYENNVKVVITFDNSCLSLKRTTDEYTILLEFCDSLTKDGNYDIKGDSIQIPIKTNTSCLEISDKKIHIEYELVLGGAHQGKFVYDIDYEVI